MRQKMTGKALIGGLHSARSVTRVPDDGEEFYETTTIQPEPVARERGFHVPNMDDYEHTLQLEGDGFEVDDSNLDDEDELQHDDKTIFPDDQPIEVEGDDEVQTLLQDDDTVAPDENEDMQTEIPGDDQTVFQDDQLQGHHFDDDDDDAREGQLARDLWKDVEKSVQLPGIDVPIGTCKKRRTA